MKKKIVVSTIGIFILSFIFHNMYKWIPSMITSILFPVNESIWEHGKMIIMSFLSLAIIERFILKDYTDVFKSNFIAGIICIVLTYALFSPVFFFILKTKDNIFVTMIIYLICVLISIFIKEKYLRKERNIKIEFISLFAFATIIITYALLSYNPIKLPIFYDYNKEIYGIPSK